MKKLLLTLVLVIVSNSAMAEWVKVAVSGEGVEEADSMTAYADPDTIRKTSNRVKMWMLTDYKITGEESGVTSARQKGEYDCKEKKERILFIVFYSGHMNKGETDLIHNVRGDWKPILQGSVSEIMLEYACAFRPKMPETFPDDTFS